MSTLGAHFLDNAVQSVFVDCADTFCRQLKCDPFILFSQEKALGFQVRQKPSLGLDVGVRNTVTGYGSLSGDLTYS